MIREAIDRIVAMATPTLFKFDKDEDDDKRIYADQHLEPIKDPEPRGIHIHTLTGLIDWIGAEAERIDRSKLIFQVCDPTKVLAIGQLQEKWEQRFEYVNVQPLLPGLFPFGEWLSIERFIIAFQCTFVDSKNKTKVLKAVSGIKDVTVKTSEDDGLSQKVAMENEVRRLEETTIEPMIALAPFRTFTEVTQPESLFLLRLRAQRDELPEVALFEADGGAWKNCAITNIADFLRDNEIVKNAGISVLS